MVIHILHIFTMQKIKSTDPDKRHGSDGVKDRTPVLIAFKNCSTLGFAIAILTASTVSCKTV